VDVDARAIELWRPGEERPEMLDQELVWRPKAELPPLVVDLPAYFAGVYDER